MLSGQLSEIFGYDGLKDGSVIINFKGMQDKVLELLK